MDHLFLGNPLITCTYLLCSCITALDCEYGKGDGECVKLFDMGDRLKNKSLYVPVVLDRASTILN
ncbi:hypothetical protein [Scytonema hofmannii]|uniref:hypothetical protein n=1 Tax=Scytonema hofmannii TaxID=34078 RepID=UPI000349739C|nr:hypothetical protein [Scytonema hofmannii]